MGSTRPVIQAPPGFTYELAEWPIFVTIRTAPPTHEAYARHLRVLDELLAREELQVHVLDILPTSAADRAQMKQQGDWNNANRDLLARYCLGVGMVLHNGVQRFGLAAMLTLTRKPIPYQVFGDRDAALSWARRQLSAGRTRA